MSDLIGLYNSDGVRVGSYCERTGRAQLGMSFLAVEHTCKNIGDDPKVWFVCSECEAHVYSYHINSSYLDEDGKRWYRWYSTDGNCGWNYCPNCGAKIVD